MAGGQSPAILRRIRERHPVALRGVPMPVGSADGRRRNYMVCLEAPVAAIDPPYVSDHLHWSRSGRFNAHESRSSGIRMRGRRM